MVSVFLISFRRCSGCRATFVFTGNSCGDRGEATKTEEHLRRRLSGEAHRLMTVCVLGGFSRLESHGSKFRADGGEC